MPKQVKLSKAPKVGQVWRVKEGSSFRTTIQLMREQDSGFFAIDIGEYSPETGFVRSHAGNTRYELGSYGVAADFTFVSETGAPIPVWKGECAECGRVSVEGDYLCKDCALTIR